MPHSQYEIDGQSYQVGPVQKCWVDAAAKPSHVKTVIEFGSFDGGDGVRYKRFWPEASVYSLEACPERIDYVRRMEKHGIHVFHAAVGSVDGDVEFFQCWDKNTKLSTSCGSIYRRKLHNREPDIVFSDTPIVVPSMRMDTFCAAQGITAIDLLHVDVEGAELGVLQGLGALRPKCLLLEFSASHQQLGAPGYDEVHGLAKDLGYYVVIPDAFDAFYLHKDVVLL